MPGVVADDIQILAIGGDRIVEEDLPDAAACLLDDMFAKGLEVAIGTDKLLFMTNMRRLRKSMLTRLVKKAGAQGNKLKRMSLVGSPFKQISRNLGVDFTLGRRSVIIQRKRLQTVKMRSSQCSQVRKAGISASKLASVAKTGFTQTAVFGSGVIGFSDSAIHALRCSVHCVLVGKPKGRSVAADLQTAGTGFGADPAITAGVALIFLCFLLFMNNGSPRR